MLPNEYDLRIVEDHFRERHSQAAVYRLAQANRLTRAPRPTFLERLRSLLARLHITRPVTRQIGASAWPTP